MDKNQLRKLANAGLSISTDWKLLSAYLSSCYEEMYESIPHIIFCKQMGWVDDSYSAYVPYSDQYLLDEKYKSKEFEAVSTPKGFLRDWVNLMSPYRTNEHIPFRIVMAASFSSVLVKPMGNLPYILHIWSTMSGSGKTVAMKAAASV